MRVPSASSLGKTIDIAYEDASSAGKSDALYA